MTTTAPDTITPTELRHLAGDLLQVANDGLLEHLDHLADPDLGMPADEAALRRARKENITR